MKIEKINDRQIRCTISREDLAKRQIKLSELVYGSDKAKMLFQDLMDQAMDEVGFDVDNAPIMVEAVPLSSESIVLIVTKVESPEELDGRFSNFTPDAFENAAPGMPKSNVVEDIAADLLSLFKKLHKDKEDSAESSEDDEKFEPKPVKGLVRLFVTDDLEDIIKASASLNGFYTEKNSLYKDEKSGLYHLAVHQGRLSELDFNRVTNVLSSYLATDMYTAGTEAYFAEHLKCIVKNKALQMLAEI